MDLVAFVEMDDVEYRHRHRHTLADLQRAHELLAARHGAPRA
jgi:hypothetical protein